MTREQVLQQWNSLCEKLGIGIAISEKWWKDIHDGYSEQGRHYHTLEHVADMLESADQDFGSDLRRPLLVHLAIFFHDLVYDPTSGSNEEDSEVLFHQFSEEVGISPSDSTKVSDYIIATKKHDVLNCEDGDLRAFIDLDMAVVGRKREDYLTYAAQIRNEYVHVPSDTYCRKRAEVLGDFLATDAIFATERYRDKLEAPARANVQAEIHLLNTGVIPGSL